MTDCAIAVRVGPPIVARVGGRLPTKFEVRFPDGAWFTIEALTMMFGITKNHLYVLLHRNRRHLTSPPVYRSGSHGAERLLSEKDYGFLRRKFRRKLRKYWFGRPSK